jgi:Porin PorA
MRNVFTRTGAGTGDGDPDTDGTVNDAPPPARAEPGTERAGRGRLRVVLAGVGAFLLVAGLLLRFYAAPQLIAAPTAVYEQDVLVSPHASYFDEGALVTRRDVRLTYTLTIRGDQRASNNTTGLWDTFASLADPQRHNVVNTVSQRYAFNRRTGQLSNCCGASINDSTSIRQSGIGLFWPIGTKKQTYSVFDNNSMKAWPATYVGPVKDTGVQTYEFTQAVPATKVDVMTGVPTSLLGISGPSKNVVANRYWEATNTFWIDPRTGVLVDEEVKGQSYLQDVNGQGKLSAVNLDLRMDQASRQSLAKQANQNAANITTISVLGPVALVVLGLILLLTATRPWRYLRRPRDEGDDVDPDADDPPSNFELLPGPDQG